MLKAVFFSSVFGACVLCVRVFWGFFFVCVCLFFLCFFVFFWGGSVSLFFILWWWFTVWTAWTGMLDTSVCYLMRRPCSARSNVRVNLGRGYLAMLKAVFFLLLLCWGGGGGGGGWRGGYDWWDWIPFFIYVFILWWMFWVWTARVADAGLAVPAAELHPGEAGGHLAFQPAASAVPHLNPPSSTPCPLPQSHQVWNPHPPHFPFPPVVPSPHPLPPVHTHRPTDTQSSFLLLFFNLPQRLSGNGVSNSPCLCRGAAQLLLLWWFDCQTWEKSAQRVPPPPPIPNTHTHTARKPLTTCFYLVHVLSSSAVAHVLQTQVHLVVLGSLWVFLTASVVI